MKFTVVDPSLGEGAGIEMHLGEHIARSVIEIAVAAPFVKFIVLVRSALIFQIQSCLVIVEISVGEIVRDKIGRASCRERVCQYV